MVTMSEVREGLKQYESEKLDNKVEQILLDYKDGIFSNSKAQKAIRVEIVRTLKKLSTI